MKQTLNANLIVKRIAAPEKTKGGILLANTEETVQPQQGKVLVSNSSITDVQVGDTVIFDKHAGTEFDLNGDKVLFIKLENIIGVVEE